MVITTFTLISRIKKLSLFFYYFHSLFFDVSTEIENFIILFLLIGKKPLFLTNC